MGAAAGNVPPTATAAGSPKHRRRRARWTSSPSIDSDRTAGGPDPPAPAMRDGS